MALNKQKGNMYGWVTHTWNPIRGKCPHDCSYCYMKSFKVGELRLDEKSLKDDLGSGNVIFVGSSCDMWARDIPREWIRKVILVCLKYSENKYLFQTKNPNRFIGWLDVLPTDRILGITFESNRNYKNVFKFNAPISRDRAIDFFTIKGKKMVSIEPILDFELNRMVDYLKSIEPEFVSIGADSKGHNLPEPSKEKIEKLIKELKKFTEVKLKDNLKRLL